MIVGTIAPHYYPSKIFTLSYTLVTIYIPIICIIISTINIFILKKILIRCKRIKTFNVIYLKIWPRARGGVRMHHTRLHYGESTKIRLNKTRASKNAFFFKLFHDEKIVYIQNNVIWVVYPILVDSLYKDLSF